MKPEDLKKMKDEAFERSAVEFESAYQSPILASLGQVNYLVTEEYDKHILEAVGKIGIRIDKQGLIDALNQDRKRYDAAYNQGWSDCEKYYKERLKEIHELSGKPVDIYD